MENKNISELAVQLADEIIDKRVKALRAGNTRYIPKNFYASSIPECDRQMVHSMLDWDKKELPDDGLLAIFEAGKKEELKMNAMLQELGFEILQQQNPIQIKNRAGETICTGRIDGKILYNGVAIPYEMKSMNDITFQSINSLEDFEKSPLLRKYIKQMQLYLYGNNIEAGLFIISNFRQIKIIPIYLDLGLCEQILQKLERNWEFVKRKEYPEPIAYNPKICDWCPFEFLCTKQTQNKPAEFIDNKELEEKIDRLKYLEPFVKEHKELDEVIKAPLKKAGLEHVVVGTKYEIIGRKQNRTSYNTALLDEATKESIKEVKEMIVYKIKGL